MLVSDEAASHIAHSGYVQSVLDQLKLKQEDDEIVLQVVYSFYRLLVIASTRDTTMHEARVFNYLCDLMHDKNRAIRTLCERFVALKVSNNVKDLAVHWMW